MANVSITSSSIFPTSITVEETGKTITLTDNTAVSKNIVVDQLTVTESPAALNDISDVNITSLADNQILVYDSATSKWINEANSASAPVTSVNTQTGAVVLDTDDISEGSTNLYFSGKTTDNLTEGSTNLYYADSLVDAHLVGGTGVTYSAGNISIGQPVATTDDVTFNTVTATNEFLGDLDGAVATSIRNTSGSTIYRGQAVYVTGLSGNTPTVSLADASNASLMPAVGLVKDVSINNNASGQMVTLGTLSAIDTSSSNQIETGRTLAVGDVLYISASEPGNVTNVKPAGESNLIQNIGTVIRVSPNTNMTFSVKGAGRSNATPNLNDGNIFIGNASNYATSSSLDTEVSALGYITASSTDTLTNKSGSNNQWTNDAGYITASSTDTLTNKSGNISQWTNDAGYLTSETDSQTLSFSSPNLTISNGNTVDISAITTGYLQQNVSTANLLADINYTTTPTNGQTLVWDSLNSVWEPGTASGGGITEVKDDTTPELGGNLDVLNQFIQSSTNFVRINDSLQIMSGNNLRFENNAQTQTVTIAATNTNTGYNLQLPTIAPSNDQYLTVNSSGQISFTNIPTIPATTDDLTEGSTNLYYTDARVQAVSINALDEDASPQLSATLDANGNNITDSTRDYVIVGNNNSPSADDYDSMSFPTLGTPGQRVRGPITIFESSGGTDRFHGNPRLNLYTLTADRNDNNARFRMNYVEGVLDTAGYNSTQSGFGRGHHGMFLSGKVRNSGGSASTVGQVRAITMSPQVDGLTSNVTVTDMRACEVQPFIASGGTVTNMYGFHYSLQNSGTVTNQYSFYGAESAAPAYNAGGFTPGAFASTALPSGLPNGTIISISDNGHKPAYNDGGTWKYVADDSSV